MGGWLLTLGNNNMARDITNEIDAVRTRLNGESVPMRAFEARINKVIDSVKFLQQLEGRVDSCPHDAKDFTVNAHNELARYLPVSAVAALEGFLRLWVTKLVDLGDPFLGRTEGFNHLKVNHQILINLHRSKFSVGEYYGHSLSFSRFDDMNVHFGTLLSEKNEKYDFISSVVSKPVQLAPHKEEKAFISKVPDYQIRIRKIYEARNIYCHELAPEEIIDFEQLVAYFATVVLFAAHVDRYLQLQISSE